MTKKALDRLIRASHEIVKRKREYPIEESPADLIPVNRSNDR